MSFWDDADDESADSGPPSPDDRLWRHPSEVAAASTAPPPPAQTPRTRGRGLSIGGAIVAATLGAATMLVAVTLIDMSDTANEVSITPTTEPTDATPVAALQGGPASTVWVQFTIDNDVERTAAVVVDDQGHLAAANPRLADASQVEAIGPNDSLLPLSVLAVDDTTGVAVLSARPSAGLEVTTSAPATVGTPVRLGTPSSGSIAIGEVAAENSTLNVDDHVERGLLTIGATADDHVSIALDTTGSRVVGLMSPLDPHPDDQLHYVIPFDIIQRVVHDYVEHGDTSPATLGVTTQRPPVPNIDEVGLVVSSVEHASELQVGDELVTVGGVAIRHTDDLAGQLLRYPRGEKIRVSVERGHQRLDLAITLPTDAAATER